MPVYPPEIDYSGKYVDEYYEYRHVILPKELMKKLPKGKLLTESVTSGNYSGMESPRRTTV
jgi:cyclin-dependent kinase regulatory subunit CKS1